MDTKRDGPATTPARPNATEDPTKDPRGVLRIDEPTDEDAEVLPFVSPHRPGWSEYLEARRQLRECNARARARRGGG